MTELTELTARIKKDLDLYGFDHRQKLGFFFYLGYCLEWFAREQGIYSSNSSKRGLMENSPNSYLLSYDFEVEENSLVESEEIRSCFLTFAKVIHEDWVKGNPPLNTFVNIGPNYLFTDMINADIWQFNQGKEFKGLNIDNGYMHFFDTVGSLLENNHIQEINDSIWYGQDLYVASMLDDLKSYMYVVDKLNTLMPPCLKIFLGYPARFYEDKQEFLNTAHISMILYSCLQLESNPLIRDRIYFWHNQVFFDDETKKMEYSIEEEDLSHTLMQMAYDGCNFRYAIDSDDFNMFVKDEGVYKLEQEGKVIDLNTYASIGLQILLLSFGYDVRKRNWANYGFYLQFLALYFMVAVRYSVYPKEIQDEV